MDAVALADALRSRAAELQDRLLARVMDNISGDVLQTRTGALKASIMADLTVDADAVSVDVASTGVPYAAIQEHGGATGPHDIVPVKARALAFAGAAGLTFARRVHHPGSIIPARSYLGGALAASHDDIVGGFKAAVLEALGAG